MATASKNPGVRKVRISLSASKKKTPRQIFMSALMSKVSGEAGEEIAGAFSKGHSEKLRDLLDGVVDELVKQASRR